MRETNLAKTKVKEIDYLVVKEPTLVQKDSSIENVLRAIVKDPHTRHAYVVDKNNVLIGSIRVNDIIQYLFPTATLLENRDIPQVGTFMEFSTATKASDIMDGNPSFVYEDSGLGELVRLMMNETINEVPVLDKQKRVVGEANILEIITHFLHNEV